MPGGAPETQDGQPAAGKERGDAFISQKDATLYLIKSDAFFKKFDGDPRYL
jgi:hypothetical protein